MSVIDRIKDHFQIAEIIGEQFTITGRGRVLTTKEHDSLKIWPDTNSWYWYSRAVGGDVLDWFQIAHNCPLDVAIDELAGRAHIERRPPTAAEVAERAENQQRTDVLELATAHYQRIISAPVGLMARRYCSTRGWNEEIISQFRLGFSGDNNHLSPEDDVNGSLANRLRQAGLLNHPLARAVLSIPQGMLVYPHIKHGRVTYLSGRSIEGKGHYNLPDQIEVDGVRTHAAGPRLPFVAEPVTPVTKDRILVEGAADAITLAQLGFRSVALCGAEVGDGFDQRHDPITHVALDNDSTGQRQALKIALAIGPTTRIVQWSLAKDANASLQAGMDKDGVHAELDKARTALMVLAAKARSADGDSRTELIREFFTHYAELDDLQATDMKPDLAAQLCGNISQFNRLLKAHKAQTAGDEKDSPERYEYSSGGAHAGRIYEQILVGNPDGTRRSIFAVRGADGKIGYAPYVDIGNITYLPFPADLGVISSDVVLFPSDVTDYSSPTKLIKDIQAFIHKYLDVDPFYERLAAYYVLFTWLYDLFENLPYLRSLGDYGTGKTRFLQAIGVLCYRPMFVSGASTVSPIFRLINMFRGTLIIDEADFSNSDAESEIIKIFNVGYYRGGVVLRSEADPESKGDAYAPAVYHVYGPKMLATRRPFTDRATESRCLTKRMTTARPRPGIPYTLGDEYRKEAELLRNKLLKYRLDNHRPIELDQNLADESVEPRLNQVTMALKSIVEDDDMRQEIDQFIRAYNDNLIADRQMTLPAIVVQALAETHFIARTNVLNEDARDFTLKGLADFSQKIINELDPDTRVTAKRVSKVLSEDLGMTRRSTCPRTRRAMLLYEEADLIALMKRYGITRPAQDNL